MEKKWQSLVMMVGIFMTLSGCGSLTQTSESLSKKQSDEIVIGGNWELSGPISAYGVVQDRAVKLAIEEKNQQGGVNGRQVKYISYDNKSTTEETVAGAEKLVSDGVNLIIGPSTTNNTLAEIPVTQREKIPLISATATADNITQDKSGKVLDYIFRICFKDSLQGGSLAVFANKKGYQTAAVIKDNSSDYGQNLTDQFKKYFKGQVIQEESYVSEEKDFQAILQNVKKAGAEMIFIAGYYENAGPLIKQAREMGLTVPILGPDGFGNKGIIELAGIENWDNIYYAAHFVENEHASDEVKQFVKKYKETYGNAPDMFAALAYDAAHLAMDAMKRAGSTEKDAIREALAQTKDFKGVTGTFSMDEWHNPSKTVFIQEVKGGKVVESTAIDPK